jgi:hypothetical protein
MGASKKPHDELILCFWLTIRTERERDRIQKMPLKKRMRDQGGIFGPIKRINMPRYVAREMLKEAWEGRKRKKVEKKTNAGCLQ